MVISRIAPFLGFLKDLEVLPPIESRGLQVFGLRGPPRRAKLSYRTLPEALAAGTVTVMEVRTARGLEAIRVMNQGDSMVLLLAGEPLPASQGAWTLRMTLLAGPQETMKVPAEQLERFPSPAPPAEAPRSQPVHLPREATGALLARGARVLGMEVFDRKETLRKCWPRIVASLDRAAQAARADEGPPLDRASAAAWLLKASAASVEALASSGFGLNLAVRGDDFQGGCLLFEHEPVHAALGSAASTRESTLPGAREVPGAARAPSGLPGSRFLPAPGQVPEPAP